MSSSHAFVFGQGQSSTATGSSWHTTKFGDSASSTGSGFSFGGSASSSGFPASFGAPAPTSGQPNPSKKRKLNDSLEKVELSHRENFARCFYQFHIEDLDSEITGAKNDYKDEQEKLNKLLNILNQTKEANCDDYNKIIPSLFFIDKR